MQRFAPECARNRAGLLLLPVRARRVVSGGVGLAREQRDEFVRALAVIQRSNQRLNDADCAVVCAGIAPGFELVRLVDVPVAEFGGLVLVEAVVHAQRNLAFFSASAKPKSAGAS